MFYGTQLVYKKEVPTALHNLVSFSFRIFHSREDIMNTSSRMIIREWVANFNTEYLHMIVQEILQELMFFCECYTPECPHKPSH